jgi:hypothetical protein
VIAKLLAMLAKATTHVKQLQTLVKVKALAKLLQMPAKVKTNVKVRGTWH